MLSDVFGQKSNVSLVFDFMDTDLEIIIKDNNIVLTPANVKAYMIMTLKGKQTYFVNLVYFNLSYNEPVNVTTLLSDGKCEHNPRLLVTILIVIASHSMAAC